MQLKLAWKRTTPNRYAEASLHDAVSADKDEWACAIGPYCRFSFQVGLRRAGIAPLTAYFKNAFLKQYGSIAAELVISSLRG
jgi:hypothetical protein